MSSANVRFEWFQTLTNLTFTFYIKNKTEEDLKVELTDKSVDVTIVVDKATQQEYQHSISPLFGAVKPETMVKTIKSMKIEITVEKAEHYQWTALEGKDLATATATDASASAASGDQIKRAAGVGNAPASYPNSKGRDWSKLQLSEEDAKDETAGDPTNAFFKQIFSNGTDEQRRAMMKSFTESGGTVLSTNWADVGNREVKGEPPKGMEEKKWNE